MKRKTYTCQYLGCGREADGIWKPRGHRFAWCLEHEQEIKPLAQAEYDLARVDWDRRHAERVAKEEAYLAELGLAVGDRVSYFAQSFIGFGGMTVTGRIVRRNGAPCIRYDQPQWTTHGERRFSGLMRGWRKVSSQGAEQ